MTEDIAELMRRLDESKSRTLVPDALFSVIDRCGSQKVESGDRIAIAFYGTKSEVYGLVEQFLEAEGKCSHTI